MRKLTTFLLATGLILAMVIFTFTSCTKEGPQGPPGTNGKDGTDGKDANETCKLCHAKAVVDSISVEFQLAKHSWGEASFEEAGNPGCSPCHEHRAFLYVCRNNTPTTFTFLPNDPNTNKPAWRNDYQSDSSATIGGITCFTCHSSLHTTYGYEDLTAFTTTAPVSMTMWGGAKTIDLTQDNGEANLCVKCHQPRPMTCNYGSPTGRLLSYDTVRDYPDMIMWDSTTGAKNKFIRPSYRMHVHYGAVGAVFAGKGGIEYAGMGYSNSRHTTDATCQNCHMATPLTGMAGGHTFFMRNAKESALGTGTTWNFHGCNVAGCHQDEPLNAKSAKWVNTRKTIKDLLDALADKINEAGGGHDILHSESDGASNLWAGITTNDYDGYMDIYDPSSNTEAYWRSPNPSHTQPENLAKPKFPSLKMVQLGAIINFQLCLREYSLGIHNTDYVTALLNNSIDAMNAAGL